MISTRPSTCALAFALGLLLTGGCSDDSATSHDGGVSHDARGDTVYKDSLPPIGDLGDGLQPPDATVTPDAGPPPANVNAALGTGLSGISDWSAEMPFVDAFKASRAWISGSTDGTWDDKRSFDLDAQGWVRSLKAKQLARTLLFWGLDDLYPAGKYVVLYDGKGTIDYWQAAKKDAAASTPGRDVVDVDPSKGGIGLTITATDGSDYLRNIRVLRPGGSCQGDRFKTCLTDAECGGAAGSCVSFEKTYATQPFYPTFLARTKTYSTLRFMDWMDTNGSDQQRWAERPKVDDARWTTKGVPAEIMIALANTLSADAWFNMPHKADNGYVTAFATLVHAMLNPAHKAYLEYSNEVWNGIFAQSGYAKQQGLTLGLSTNDYQAQLFYYSQRAVEIFKLWQAAFGADKGRVVRVMGSQAASTWVSEQVLTHKNAAAETDALAIAPYFGGYLGGTSEQARVQAMSLAALFSELNTVALPKSAQWVTDTAALAQTHGVDLIAYEGGQHLAGNGGVENDAAINTLFDDANRDARMGAVYAAYFAAWKSAGGKLFVHFVNCGGYSKWGRWGALEHIGQARSAAPKFDALQTFIETTPKWW